MHTLWPQFIYPPKNLSVDLENGKGEERERETGNKLLESCIKCLLDFPAIKKSATCIFLLLLILFCVQHASSW